MTRKTYCFICLFVVLLVGCLPAAKPMSATQSATPTDLSLATTDTPVLPTPTAEPALPSLSLDPQRIEFQTEDGATLVGYYYPAAVDPAPVVVLMHWAGGNQTDWLYVGMVAWLQNRGAVVPTPSKPELLFRFSLSFLAAAGGSFLCCFHVRLSRFWRERLGRRLAE